MAMPPLFQLCSSPRGDSHMRANFRKACTTQRSHISWNYSLAAHWGGGLGASVGQQRAPSTPDHFRCRRVKRRYFPPQKKEHGQLCHAAAPREIIFCENATGCPERGIEHGGSVGDLSVLFLPAHEEHPRHFHRRPPHSASLPTGFLSHSLRGVAQPPVHNVPTSCQRVTHQAARAAGPSARLFQLAHACCTVVAMVRPKVEN